MENINITEGQKNLIFKSAEDIINSLMKDEKLIGVIPFVSGNFKFLNEKKYLNQLTISKKRKNIGIGLITLCILSSAATYILFNAQMLNVEYFIATLVITLSVTLIFYYIVYKFFKNINLVAISEKNIYFVSIREEVPIIRKRGFILSFYATFPLKHPYAHYCSRCADLFKFQFNSNSLLATIDLEEYTHKYLFKTTLLPIAELNRLSK